MCLLLRYTPLQSTMGRILLHTMNGALPRTQVFLAFCCSNIAYAPSLNLHQHFFYSFNALSSSYIATFVLMTVSFSQCKQVMFVKKKQKQLFHMETPAAPVSKSQLRTWQWSPCTSKALTGQRNACLVPMFQSLYL